MPELEDALLPTRHRAGPLISVGVRSIRLLLCAVLLASLALAVSAVSASAEKSDLALLYISPGDSGRQAELRSIGITTKRSDVILSAAKAGGPISSPLQARRTGMVFVSRSSGVLAVPLRTPTAFRVIWGEGSPLVVSPGGRWLIVESDDRSRFFLVDTRTRVGRLLTTDAVSAAFFPVGWTADGRYIIGRAPKGLGLYTLRGALVKRAPDTMNSNQLTVAPDGRGASVDLDPSLNAERLQLIATDFSHVGWLGTPKRGEADQLPAWSPDSRQLAYVESSRGKADVIRLIGLDGRNRGEIRPEIKGGIISLSWGPDGRHVAFEALSRTSTQVSLWVADVKTGAVQELVKDVSPDPPSWLP